MALVDLCWTLFALEHRVQILLFLFVAIKDFSCKVYIERLRSIRLLPHRNKFFGLPEQNFSERFLFINPTDWDA